MAGVTGHFIELVGTFLLVGPEVLSVDLDGHAHNFSGGGFHWGFKSGVFLGPGCGNDADGRGEGRVVASGAPGRMDSAGGPGGGILAVGAKDADDGKIPVALGEIQAVPDDELVGYLEADEFGLDRHLAPGLLV